MGISRQTWSRTRATTSRTATGCCVQIAGMMHILHNLDKTMDEGLDHFDPWYRDLQNSSELLCDIESLRLVKVACVAGTTYERSAACLFEKAPPFPYEKRWGHVIDYLREAWQLLLVLRACWSETKYIARASSQAGQDDPDRGIRQNKFKPERFTAMLRSTGRQ